MTTPARSPSLAEVVDTAIDRALRSLRKVLLGEVQHA